MISLNLPDTLLLKGRDEPFLDFNFLHKEKTKALSTPVYNFWLCYDRALIKYENLGYPDTDVIFGDLQALYILQALAAEYRLQDIAGSVSRETVETCMRQVQSDKLGIAWLENRIQQVYRYLEAKSEIAQAISYLDTRVQIHEPRKILELIQDSFCLSQSDPLSKDNVRQVLDRDPLIVRTDYESDDHCTSFEVSYLSDTLISHLPMFNFWQSLLMTHNELLAVIATREIALRYISRKG